jgi:hypothetical protein
MIPPKEKRESQFDEERNTKNFRVREGTGNEAGGKFIDYSRPERARKSKQWTSLFPAPCGRSISGHLLAIH